MNEVIAALEPCVDKGAAAATSVGDESAAACAAKDQFSFMNATAPCSTATVFKRKVEKLSEATIAHRAAAETSKHPANDERRPAVPRKKKTLGVGIGLGLLGVFGIIVLAVAIRNRRPNGKETSVTVPDGSTAMVSEKGDVNVTLAVDGGKPAAVSYGPDAPPLAVAPFDAAKAKQHQEAWAKHLGVPVEITNSIGMKLLLIPPGQFLMGSTVEEINMVLAQGLKDKRSQWWMEGVPGESPRRRVEISVPFYMAIYPVTQAEYEKVTGVNPSSFAVKQMDASAFKPRLPKLEIAHRKKDGKKAAGWDTSRHPVESVSWEEAVEFCRKLSLLPAEKAAGRVCRLPTEAEREYACRAGTTTRWWCGDDEADLLACAWFHSNSDGMTHPVGQKKPSPWGLYDMHGGVWQWCADWFAADYYKQAPSCDPTGPGAGFKRVLRGGTWDFIPSLCRSAHRNGREPTGHSHDYGFRVVVGLPR